MKRCRFCGHDVPPHHAKHSIYLCVACKSGLDMIRLANQTPEQREARLARRRERDRKRYAANPDAKNESNRQWQLQNRPRYLGLRSARQKRKADEINAKRRAAHEHNKHKARARYAVKQALLHGTLVRPDVCSACQNIDRLDSKPLHAHHPDYSKPLDVEWLCQVCHSREHAKERREAQQPASAS